MGKQDAQHDTTLVELILEFRERCAQMAAGYVYGSAAAQAIRTIGVAEIQRILRVSEAKPAQIVRKGLEVTPEMLRAEHARAMDLVKRATNHIRELRDQLARAEAMLAMLEDPAPLDAVHGTTAANEGKARAAA